MLRVTLGHTIWNIDYNPNRGVLVLEGEGPMPKDYAISLAAPRKHMSEQTPPNQLPDEVDVSAVRHHPTPESSSSSPLGFVEDRAVVLTPIECDINEALHLVIALLSHIPPKELPSPLDNQDVHNLIDQIQVAVDSS